jgi:hypothetical protein
MFHTQNPTSRKHCSKYEGIEDGGRRIKKEGDKAEYETLGSGPKKVYFQTHPSIPIPIPNATLPNPHEKRILHLYFHITA